MEAFVKRQNQAPTVNFFESAIRAYKEYFVVLYKDGPDRISAWLIVYSKFADAIVPWALDDMNVKVPTDKELVFLKGHINHEALRNWLVRTPMMEPSQPEVMFDCDLTSEWQIVEHDGPLVPQEVCGNALFASGFGFDKDEDHGFVPALKGFEDDYNVGVDLVYAINSTWETMFTNSNFKEVNE
jgi:hypothetical protein